MDTSGSCDQKTIQSQGQTTAIQAGGQDVGQSPAAGQGQPVFQQVDSAGQSQGLGKQLVQPPALSQDRVAVDAGSMQTQVQATQQDQVQEQSQMAQAPSTAQVQQQDQAVVVQDQHQVAQAQGQAQIKQAEEAPIEPKIEKPSIPAGRPAGAKEAEFVSGGDISPNEQVPIVEVREQGELSPEVEGWIERAESDDVPDVKPVVYEGKTYAELAVPSSVKVRLPLDEEEIKKGLHHKIADSVRWLAQWCMRIVGKYKGNVGYKGAKQPEAGD